MDGDKMSYEDESYELLANVDEYMTTLKTLSNSMKNAEDVEKNLATLVKVTDAVDNIRRLYNYYTNLALKAYEEDEAEEEDNPYNSGMDWV